MGETDVTKYLKKYLKKDAMESILAAIVFLIIGILFVKNPEAIKLTFSYIAGGIFVLVGILKVINYFVEKGNEDFFNYDLVFGIIAIIIGVVFITQYSFINTLFRIAIAIWLMYSGLIRGTTAIKLKSFEVKNWWVILVSAVLMVLAGLYIMSFAGIIEVTLGIIMICYAVIDIINGILFMIDINRY